MVVDDMEERHGEVHGVEHKLLLMSHWSSNWMSSSGVGPPPNVWSAQREQIQKIVHRNRLELLIDFTLCRIFFLNEFKCSGQIPHLYSAIAVTGQNESPWHRTHSRWFLTFVDTKWCDYRSIDGLDDAHTITIWCKTNVQLVRIWNNFLHKYLSIVLLTEWAKIVAGRIAVWAVGGIQWNNLQEKNHSIAYSINREIFFFRYLEWSFRCGSGLSRDHTAKPRHTPSAYMIVFTAHRYQKIFGQFYFGDGTLMHGECLEELWTVSNSLWMLDNHTHRTRSCAVSNFNPVATQTYRIEMFAWEWELKLEFSKFIFHSYLWFSVSDTPILP